ncbi:MAG: HYR domain-containing protein, partial [Candidatus Bipolaricaulaceae bacterium]
TPPTASDNCGVVSFTSTHNPGDVFPVGTTTVTYTARDAAGNTASCSFKVTVVDNTPPAITCPTPAPAYNADPGKCYASLSFAATATDNCGVAGITYRVNGSPITFPYNFPVGTTTVQVIATDIHGNSASCSFQVRVVDTQPPVISGCPGDLTVYTGPGRTTCDQVAFWTPPTASDNCGVVSFTSTHNPGDVFPVGTTTVTYTARDAAGNTASSRFKVTVVDNTPPVAGDDVASVDKGGVVVIPVLANDYDACGTPVILVSAARPRHGTVAIVQDGVEYRPDRLFYGVDVFTYTVRDSRGNTASAMVRVTVRYVNAPPVAEAGGPYRGRAGEPVLFDAGFSYDPDIEDTLEYRWDVDGDGKFDTEWAASPRISWVFDRPFFGFASLEVRDIHRGQPTGAVARASALVLIMPRPTEIAVSVFVDLNEDGVRDEKDVGFPGITLVLDGSRVAVTDKNGVAVFSEVTPGRHVVAISEESIKVLRDYGLDPGEGVIAVEVEAGEWVELFFIPKRKGFLRVEVEQVVGGR